jgi:hypothetical protein
VIRLKNPIPEQIKDDEKLKQLIAGLKLVPYAGTNVSSSQRLLSLLYDLYDLSTSHGACINDQLKYGFEGDLELTPSSIPGLKSEIEELPWATIENIANTLLESGVRFIDIVELTKKLFTNYKVSGNWYLMYREIIVGGEKRISLKSVHPINIMYLYTDEPIKTFVIANEWTSKYLSSEDRHQMVRAYPDFTEFEDGRATIFHWKNQTDEAEWYGRPDSFQSLMNQYAEFETDNLVVKTARTEFVAKKILFTEGPEYEDDEGGDNDRAAEVRKKAQALRNITQNNSPDPHTIAVYEYAKGTTMPELGDLEVMRDSKWLETISARASASIYEAHGWSKQLSGKMDTKAGIGSNILKDLFLIKDETVIRPYQDLFSRFWSEVFDVMGEFLESEELRNATVKFPNKIEKLIESLGDADNSERSDLLEQGIE